MFGYPANTRDACNTCHPNTCECWQVLAEGVAVCHISTQVRLSAKLQPTLQRPPRLLICTLRLAGAPPGSAAGAPAWNTGAEALGGATAWPAPNTSTCPVPCPAAGGAALKPPAGPPQKVRLLLTPPNPAAGAEPAANVPAAAVLLACCSALPNSANPAALPPVLNAPPTWATPVVPAAAEPKVEPAPKTTGVLLLLAAGGVLLPAPNAKLVVLWPGVLLGP